MLARRTAVIETLGAATVLCVDKTGTITQNRMSVKCIVIDGVEHALDRTGDSSGLAPDAVCELLRQAVLASEILPFDPMEKAFHQSAERLCPSAKEASANWDFVHEYPLTGELPAMTHVWREPGDGLCHVAAKGAPEAIARMCHEVNRAYCLALGDTSQPAWEDAPDWQKDSARKGVRLHLDDPNAGPQASHESWMAQKQAEGWTWGPAKDPEKKQHHCMVPFDQLPREQQAKDYLFRGVVHAMAGRT